MFAIAPDATDPADLGVLEAAELLRSGRLSSTELTAACLARIEARNGGPPTFDGAPEAINAWARVYPELAAEQAREADARRGRHGDATALLCGIPLAVKDLYGVAGLPLTASSRVLEGNVADTDAAVWARLRAAGMVLLGHAHTHEFAAGGTTDQVGNPWALHRVAGGSSGGSAAAVAAGMTPGGLGSDTCGSLRIPSACCGTSTIKPTHGRLPLDGVIPLAPSLDHPGPMARTVADCSALLAGCSAIPGPTTPRPGPRPLHGVTIALTERPEQAATEAAVLDGLDRARQACEQLGAHVVGLPAAWTMDWDDLTIVLMTEVWRYHAAHASSHERYRPAIAEFVEISERFTHEPPYAAAQRRRDDGARAWEQWFSDHGVDCVLEPTLPIVPPARGPGYDRGHAGGAGDALIALTSLWDLTRMPVVALPVSWDVGVSLIAPADREPDLIQLAIDLQAGALPVPRWTPA